MENLKLNQMESLGQIKVVRNQKIYSTKNYDLFNISEINRNIKANNVNVIKNSISSEGQQKPIVVDDKMFIIDGQHRYSALRELNLPVEFVLSKRSGNTMKDKMSIMESQNVSFSWNNMEKLELRSKIDNNYFRLKNLINEYGFALATTCDILWNRRTHITTNERMRNNTIGFLENTMVITEEMINESKVRFDKFKKLNEINKHLLKPSVFKLIQSFSNNQKLDINVLITKAEKYNHKIEDLYISNKPLDFIEKLYNFNSKKQTYFIEPKKLVKLNNKK